MLIAITIECPMCGDKCGSLSFWKKVGEMYFHICEKCLNKDKTTEQLLRLAYNSGYTECRKDIRNKI